MLEKAKSATTLFDIKPSDSQWSIHQVLAHLIAAEKLSVSYLEKKLNGIEEVRDTWLWEDLKMLLLKISQRLPLKFKAPKKVVESTPTYPSFHSLEEDWIKTREALKAQLLRIKDDQVKRKIFKHVVAGKLNILHALDFLAEHVNHHRPQLDRLVNDEKRTVNSGNYETK